MNFKKSWFSYLLILTFLVGCNSQAQKTNLPVNEFEKKITTGKFQLLDVRTADEFENGHLKNSLQADWNNEEQF
ncbi:MAG: rhodanese-like domain-containing protein, partial [Gloeobacteraceae cyanobacterium ES-bin-316]|nr:rhodanese-like domain-containing protein [Ferruginibacter sp.]